MNPKPVKIERITSDDASAPPESENEQTKGTEGAGGIRLTWSDGRTNTIDSLKLRRLCPCASCLEARGEGAAHEKPLSAAPSPENRPSGKSLLQVVKSSAEEETRIDKIWSVGSYALGIRWGDKHDSGIYTWDYLREISGLNCPSNS